ncbi:hypothetical protein VTN96DRAFT_7803 [Rasamsonia emersonii]
MIVDSNRVIIASTDNPSTVKLDASNALLMTHEGLEARPIVDAPDLDQSVSRRGDYLIVIDLDGIHGGSVPIQGHQKGVRCQRLDVAAGELRLQQGRRHIARVDDIRGIFDAGALEDGRIVLVQGSQLVTGPDLDQLILRTRDQVPFVELEVQHGVFVRRNQFLKLLAGRKAPNDDVPITAAGHDDIFGRIRVKLEAKDRLGMPEQRRVPQPPCFQVPDADCFVATAADQPSAGELDGVDAFLVCFFEMGGIGQLEIDEAAL